MNERHKGGKCVSRRCVRGDYRPTIMSSTSDAFLWMRRQMSMVKMVDEELKMEVSDDTSADIITASIKPRRPSGISSSTKVG